MDEGILDVSHEALIDAWPRLREWLDKDREALRRRQWLTHAAADWDRNARDPELLFRGSRLAEWDDGDFAGLNEVEQAFLAAGRLAETERVVAARRRRRQRTGGLGLVAMVVAVLVVIALVQADRGADDRDRAFSRKLATEARRQLTIDPSLALLLATKAYETAPTAEADSVLRQAVLDSRLRWSSATGLQIARGMAASADGTTIAVWGDGREPGTTVQLWRWNGGALAKDGPDLAPRQTVTGVAVSADGRRLAIAGKIVGGAHAVTVWELAGERRRTKVLSVGGSGTLGAAFSPDGRLAGFQGRVLKIWDLDGTRKTADLRALGPFQSVAFSSDGDRMVTGGLGLPARLWDVTGPRLKGLQTAVSGSPEKVALSPDGIWAASAELQTAYLRTARGWPAREEWKPQGQLRGHGDTVGDVVFSKDSGRLATFANDRTVRVWSTGSTLDPFVLRMPTESARGVAFAPDGRSLAGVSGDGTLNVWNLDAGASPVTSTLGAHSGRYGRSISADGRYVAGLAADGDDTVVVWDTVRGGAPILDRRLARGEAQAVALSPDGRKVIAAGRGPTRMWDLPSGGEPMVLPSRGGSELVFSRDGRSLAVAATAGPKVWRLPDQGPPAEVTGWRRAKEASSHVGGLAFSPDGSRLAGGREDNSVWVWDLTPGKEPQILRGSRRKVDELAFSPDGRLLAGAADDGDVWIWDLAERGAVRRVLKGDGTDLVLGRQLAFSPDGNWLATTEPAGGLRLWPVDGGADPLVFSGIGTTVGLLAFDGKKVVAALTGDVGPSGAVLWQPPARVRMWECEVCGPGDQVLGLARRRAIRAFTPEERRLYLER
ncbi:WD40 repeat domain-containing protein [Actinomadura rudentiformis]|uniref:WD40 repeat domain-containing protein n=2 Tax=Actinomadura rudentiformis TaxID=359158 RepID=A0A6H9YUK7_9ACTN|nr:WD40 repeat domain-containing protein [Actinomadura rudentiformis]